MNYKAPIISLSMALLTACGGSSSNTNNPVAAATNLSFSSHTIIDPTETAGNKFGQQVVELSNGNIAVQSRNLPNTTGAIHIYNPLTQTLVKTISGATTGDLAYSNVGLTPLANGNLVIASSSYDVGGLANAGAVFLINGSTGEQIGATISGDDAGDEISSIGITTLSNGLFAISSHNDKVSGMSKAGSVILVNGSTGAVVKTITGDNADDQLGAGSITELNNGNIVMVAERDVVAGKTNAGSVRLLNGTTGALIGTPITGDDNTDVFGQQGVFGLDNGNYVIASARDDIGGLTNVGSVRLVNGTTGLQIGATIVGDNAVDNLSHVASSSHAGIVPLANSEFAVVSELDNVGGVSDAGSIMFFNGSTGAQIGSTISGNNPTDKLGSGGVFQLSNGNIVISSPLDNLAASDEGSVLIVDGTTKNILSTLSANDPQGRFGTSGVVALGNGNFVVSSADEDNMGVANVGSVRVYNSAGTQVGSTFFGDTAVDVLGRPGITVLENNNFTIASRFDDVNGISNAGSVMLINGTTGAQIGSTLAGSTANDYFGSNSASRNGVVALKGSNNYVIASSNADVNGVMNVGSVVLINGDTGIQIGNATTGNDENDYIGQTNGRVGVIVLANGNYLINSENNDDNGNVDTGSVLYRLGK